MLEDYSAFKFFWQSIPERPDVILPDRYTHYNITVQYQTRTTEFCISLPKTIVNPTLTQIQNFVTIEIGTSMMDQKIYDEASKNAGEEMAALFCKTHRDLVIQREAIKRVLGPNIFNYLFCLTHLPYYEKTLH